MKNIIKNIFRYSFKNKFSILGIFILFFILISIVLTLTLLSKNFNDSYNTIVKESNLHNIVLNENFTNNKEGEVKKEEFMKILTSSPDQTINNQKGLGLDAREFNSINIKNYKENYKIIDYSNNYNIDKLYYFNTDNVQNFSFPTNLDFADIIKFSGQNLTYSPDQINNIDIKHSIECRQFLVYLAAKAHWSDELILDKFQKALNYLSQNPNTDPFNLNKKDPNAATSVEIDNINSYLKKWLDPSDPNYTPIVSKGYRILFNVNSKTTLIPKQGYYDDFSSYLAVVSPAYLKENNKKVFSLDKFKQLTNTQDGITINSLSYDQFYGGNNNGWVGINNLPDEYYITIDSIKYLIVASGISADFLYPIISFENLVVDFTNEAVLYANNSGFERAKNSWETAEQENLILVKYNGDNIKGMINQLNELAHKYMSFPSDFQIAYSYNDDTNQFTPSALRINFISDLMTSLNAISAILTIFLVIVSLFVLLFILDKFIKENKVNFYILIANGVNKWKAIFSLLFIPILPLILASILGYIFAWATQDTFLGIFSNYWSIPTPIHPFNFGIIFLVFFILMLISSIILCVISYIRLSGNVADSIKEKTLKVSWFSILVKKPFIKSKNIIFKFRLSLAFSSIWKILFCSFIGTLLITCLTFLFSTNNDFVNSINNTKRINNYENKIDLNTPTRNGGQYFATEFDKLGTLLKDKNQNILNPSVYSLPNSGYSSEYNNNPNFQTWSQVLWPSSNDKKDSETQLNYLYNRINFQPVMQVNIGVGQLGSNPWNDLAKPVIPANQQNTSLQFSQELFNYLYNDYLVMNPKLNLNVTDPKNPNPECSKNKRLLLTNENINFYKDNSLGIPIALPIINISNVQEFKNHDNILNPTKCLEILKAKFPKIFTTQNLLKVSQTKEGYILDFDTDLIIQTNNSIMNYLYEKETKPIEQEKKNNYIQIYDKLTNTSSYYIVKKHGLSSYMLKLPEYFINYWTYVLENPDVQYFLYKISYNIVPISSQDEKYVYINADISNNKFDSKYKINKEIEITGIIPNSKYIKLKHQELLFSDEYKNLETKPLIINAYAAKLYNLNIGDIINIFPNNHVDRYHPDFKNKSLNKELNAKFKVVDIDDSAKGPEFYTNIEYARQIIGLSTHQDYINNQEPVSIFNYPYPNSKLNNKYNDGGFNGVFTNKNLELITNNIALYSNSGIYPGTDKFDLTYTLRRVLQTILNTDPNNLSPDVKTIINALFLTPEQQTLFLQNITNPKLVDSIINQLNIIYGNSIYNSSINYVDALNLQLNSFNEIITTINKIKYIVISLLTSLSLVIFLFISWVIINETKILFVLLKTQGYSTLSILISVLSIFLPIFIISFLLSIPFSILSISLFNEFIFLKMGMLLFNVMNFGYLIVGTIILMLIIYIISFINFLMLNKENLVLSLKW